MNLYSLAQWGVSMQVKDPTKVYSQPRNGTLRTPLEKQGQPGPGHLLEPTNIALEIPKLLAVQEHPQAAIRVFGQNAGLFARRCLGLGLGSLVQVLQRKIQPKLGLEGLGQLVKTGFLANRRVGHIAQLTLGHPDQVSKEVLQLADNSPIGFVYPDQANWLLLIHL